MLNQGHLYLQSTRFANHKPTIPPDTWTKSPRDSELSAQGTVLVSLFLDLAPWLENPGRDQFDNQRGTEKWTTQLRHLALPDGPFTLWQKQAELINIGHDLNLFREQAHRSFMPIYEAPADTENLGINWDRQLQRLALKPKLQAKAKETLIQEWRHWDRVRLQITRDGTVHLTPVRQINSPLPLMQILNILHVGRALAADFSHAVGAVRVAGPLSLPYIFNLKPAAYKMLQELVWIH